MTQVRRGIEMGSSTVANEITQTTPARPEPLIPGLQRGAANFTVSMYIHTTVWAGHESWRCCGAPPARHGRSEIPAIPPGDEQVHNYG